MAGKEKTHGRLRVQVTEADIAKAEQNKSMKCVVAQALRRSIPGATRVDVDVQSIRWTGADGVRYVYLTPYPVQGYVVAFDAGDVIHPFTFTLDPRSRIPVKRQVRTAAGTAVSRANGRVQGAKQKRARVAAKVENGEAPAVQLKKVDREVAAEQESYSAVKAAYEGQKQVVTSGEGRHAVPRIGRSSVRRHGIRVLRINQ